MKLPSIPVKHSSKLLRILTGFIFVSHGAARLYYDSVSSFGGFLNSKGFVIGVFLAWAVTLGEIISGTLLAIDYKVKICAIFHTLIVTMGIFLVHVSNGWFTVGHGSGGVEYSLVLLAVLLHLYSADSK